MYFLVFLLIAIAIGTAESISDSIKANNYKKSGGFYAKYPAFRPKNGNYNSNNNKK